MTVNILGKWQLSSVALWQINPKMTNLVFYLVLISRKNVLRSLPDSPPIASWMSRVFGSFHWWLHDDKFSHYTSILLFKLDSKYVNHSLFTICLVWSFVPFLLSFHVSNIVFLKWIFIQFIFDKKGKKLMSFYVFLPFFNTWIKISLLTRYAIKWSPDR